MMKQKKRLPLLILLLMLQMICIAPAEALQVGSLNNIDITPVQPLPWYEINPEILKSLNVPSVPTKLNAKATGSSVYLWWWGSTGATGYEVQRRTAVDPYTLVGSCKETYYNDDKLNPGTKYYYRVRAVNDHGTSGWSAEVLAQTHTSFINTFQYYDFLLDAPQAVWITEPIPDDFSKHQYPDYGTETSAGGVVLKKSITLEDGVTYPTALLTSPPANGGLLRGFFGDFEIPYQATLRVVCGYQQGASVINPVRFRVSFTPSDSFLEKILIDETKWYDGKLKTINYDLSSLAGKSGKLYLIAVQTGKGYQPIYWQTATISNQVNMIVSIIPLLSNWFILEATPGNKQVQLKWNIPSSQVGIAGYNIYKGTSSGGVSATPINDFLIKDTSYTDTNVVNGTTYYYSVISVPSDGSTGATSNQVNATPLNIVTIVMQVGNPYMQVNGVNKEIDPGKGTVPVIISGRFMLPISALVAEMGGTTLWDPVEQKVTIVLKNTVIKLWINSNQAEVNGQMKTIDVPAQIINNRTMVPLRFVAENVNCQTDWNNNTNTVTLTYQID